MARTRKTITLDEKIEKAQAEVFQAKDKYDSAVEELNKLQKKKPYDEIMKFLTGKPESDEE